MKVDYLTWSLCQQYLTQENTLKVVNKLKKQRVRTMTLCELDKLIEVKLWN